MRNELLQIAGDNFSVKSVVANLQGIFSMREYPLQFCGRYSRCGNDRCRFWETFPIQERSPGFAGDFPDAGTIAQIDGRLSRFGNGPCSFAGNNFLKTTKPAHEPALLFTDIECKLAVASFSTPPRVSAYDVADF